MHGGGDVDSAGDSCISQVVNPALKAGNLGIYRLDSVRGCEGAVPYIYLWHFQE